MKNLFSRYSLNSIVTEGKGVDKFITYIEKEDGTPLSEQELDSLDHSLQLELIGAKLTL